MTLDTVARYDGDRVGRVGDHAVVVGAGMGGLLAGRVLADAFDEVTVLDRDHLPEGPVARRGVPQADHVHVMLEPGRVTLEDLFPGYEDDLRSAGGLVIDAATELEYYHEGDFLAEGPDRLPMCCASRPLYEHLVRRRLAARDDVAVRPECHVAGYETDGSGSRVQGVRIVGGGGGGDGDGDGGNDDRKGNGDGGGVLDADLVVDATGRTSSIPDWLDRHGYPTPAEDEVTVDLAYSTTVVERPPGERRAYLVAPSSPVARGGTAVPVEGDRWIVTLFGLHGDHPPADPDGFRAFAADLPTGELADLLDEHPWDSGDIHRYPFPSSLRRRYWDLDRFPEGLLVTGDAVASFNPIYGQGMSVAALDALQLHHGLAADGLADLPERFFDRVGGVVDDVWTMTVGADFEFDGTTGPKPRGTDLFNRYVSRVIRTAHADAVVSDRFARVLRLERQPTALLSPGVLVRVLAPRRVGRYL